MKTRLRNRLRLVGWLVGLVAVLLCAGACGQKKQSELVVEHPVAQEQSGQPAVSEITDSTSVRAKTVIDRALPKVSEKIEKRRSKVVAAQKEIKVAEVRGAIVEITKEPEVSADTVVLQAEVLSQDTMPKSIEEEVPLMKAIGRFDRKIENRLLVKKGSWMGGLTFSWAEYNSEDTQFLSLIKDFNCKANMLAVNPFIGYFYKNNACLGVKFGFERVSASLGGLNIDIDDDMSFGLSDMAFKQEMLRTTLFHRSYVGLDKDHRFGLFNEIALSFNTGTSSYERPVTEELKNTSTRIREIQIGLNPGATVFIMENVAAELSFGIAGFKYRQENQTVNGEASGWRKSSGANFKINLLNINIGVVAYL